MGSAISGRSAIRMQIAAVLLLLVGCSCDLNTDGQQPWTGAGTGNANDAGLDFPQYEEWPFDDAEAKRRQEETAARLGIPVTQRLPLGDGVHLDLVLIPAGRFVMGFKGCSDNEPREVTIAKPFYIGALEVTYRQYQVFRQNSQDARPTNCELDAILKHAPDRLDSPVLSITWTTCNHYCRAASTALGCTIRLPWEREWEYAARAGTTGKFLWDDTLQPEDPNAERLQPVDGKVRSVQKGSLARPNPWGVYDMIGSVSEWVIDVYTDDEYSRTLRDGRAGDEGVVARHPELRWGSGPYDGFRALVEIDRPLLSLLKRTQNKNKRAQADSSQ